MIIVFGLIGLLLLALIVGVLWSATTQAKADRMCMNAGYLSATAYMDGTVYCHKAVDGSSATVLFRRAERRRKGEGE
jgi:hypothetical protein